MILRHVFVLFFFHFFSEKVSNPGRKKTQYERYLVQASITQNSNINLLRKLSLANFFFLIFPIS